MIRRLTISALMVFLVVFLGTKAWTQDLAGKLGLSPRLGLVRAVSGSYDASTKTSDLLQVGMTYGVSLRHRISRHYAIDVAFDFGWLEFEKTMKEDPSLEPGFVMPAITLANSVVLPVGPAGPYVSLGVGIYPWKFTVDGPTGEPATFEGEKLKKMSVGLNGGIGIELWVTDWLSLYGEGRLHYLLSRDRFFFGSDFTEQGFLAVVGGITVYPVRWR